MASLNDVTLVARIAGDPTEVETKTGTLMCVFHMAIVRPKRKGHFYVECRAWGAVAKYVLDFFTKGEYVWVKGNLNRHHYKDKLGIQHNDLVVNVNLASSAQGEPEPREFDITETETFTADEDDIVGELPYL